jgi:TonB family protein
MCAAGALNAQEEIVPPGADSVILTEKQATGMVVVQTKPEYPAVAKVNYLQGHVQLKVTVDGEGKVTRAHVVEGDAVLAASALEAVRSWTYRPLATSAGPVGFVTIVKVKYFLSSTPAETVAELSPRRAESDFLRQVKPPQVLSPQEDTHSGDSVRLRLLVNEQGKVDDIEISPASSRPQAEMALEDLRSWTFRPARWGNLPIASYLDVDVPVTVQSVARIASSHGNR